MGVKQNNLSETDLQKLLELLPEQLYKSLLAKGHSLNDLQEIIMDYGRMPELRYTDNRIVYIDDMIISQIEINQVVEKIGSFNTDNRAGIEKTLHRISAIRNRQGKVIGLTCRVGRFMEGTINISSRYLQRNSRRRRYTSSRHWSCSKNASIYS